MKVSQFTKIKPTTLILNSNFHQFLLLILSHSLSEAKNKKPIYEELFKDLRETPSAIMHQPLSLTRNLAMIILIFIIDVYNEDTVYILFCLLIFIQTAYILQAWHYPKFKLTSLTIIYILNEVFLLVFIVLFLANKRSEDWNGRKSIFLLLFNIY